LEGLQTGNITLRGKKTPEKYTGLPPLTRENPQKKNLGPEAFKNPGSPHTL